MNIKVIDLEQVKDFIRTANKKELAEIEKILNRAIIINKYQKK